MSKLVKTCQNLSTLVKTCQTLSSLVKTCQNMSKLVRNWSNWSKLVQSGVLRLVWYFSKLVKTCPNLFEIVYTCDFACQMNLTLNNCNTPTWLFKIFSLGLTRKFTRNLTSGAHNFVSYKTRQITMFISTLLIILLLFRWIWH